MQLMLLTRTRLIPFCLASAVTLATPSTSSAEDGVDFARDIQPLLRKHCYRCHGPSEREGGVRLDLRKGAFGEGDSGEPLIVPHRPEDSLLWRRLSDPEYGELMPMDGQPLGEEEIATIARWIGAGASWSDDQPSKDDSHWAYQPLGRPKVPASTGATSAIDAFILERLPDTGLPTSPKLDRARLLRRLYLALIGVPPSPGEVSVFIADDSRGAIEREVDRLLQSPRFGERWATPWLDLARYADSNGFQADQLRDNWAYRDYVIRSLNEDKPFDRFVIEQLAGDLLPEASLEQKIATGFHRMTTCNVEAGVDPEANRVNQVVDRVNTTATVMMGSTLECAQCHDHKYDPFTQKEYYQLFAYFNNTPIEVEQATDVRFDFVGPKLQLPLSEEQQQRKRQLRKKVDATRRQEKAYLTSSESEFECWLADMRGSWQAFVHRLGVGHSLTDSLETCETCLSNRGVPPESAGHRCGAGGDRAFAKPGVPGYLLEPQLLSMKPSTFALITRGGLSEDDREQLRPAFDATQPEWRRIAERRERLQKQLDAIQPDSTLVMVEQSEPRETYVMLRGDYESPGEQVEPDIPAVFERAPSVPRTGDRLELARWLTSSANPLLPRVTINRWWRNLFGEGLVRTPEDFGSQAEPPTHPELLDWLGCELVDSGWSMKHVIKLMVMSEAFQRSSPATSEVYQQDPENRWLARGPRIRLPAEMIRDNALAVSGLLHDRMYGEPIMPYQPDGLWKSVGRNQPSWKMATDANRFRRGLYVVWKRAIPYPSFVNFDATDRSSCTVERSRSNTPLQALTLLNDPAYAEMALALADRILSEAFNRQELGGQSSPTAADGDEESLSVSDVDRRRIEYGFRLVLARRPTSQEVAMIAGLLTQQREQLTQEQIEARTRAALTGLELRNNPSRELAAWFAVANALLNLDETITR